MTRPSGTDSGQIADLSLREAAGHSARPVRRRAPRFWTVAGAVAVLVMVVAVALDNDGLVRPGGLSLVAEFFGAATHPRVDGAFVELVARATVTTLAYAVLGTVLSLIIGVVGGVLSSHVWWASRTTGRTRPLGVLGWLTTRIVLVLPRGVHEVVWGLILLSVLGIQPLVAVLAIGIPFGAVTAKVFSEILDDTARDAHRALVATGARRLPALLYGVLPSALPDLLSYGFYRLECAIRSAAILGLIGVGGLGFELQLSFQALRYEEIWTLLFALIALCAAADFWSWAVRSRRSLSRTRVGRDSVSVASLVLAVALVPASVWWVGLSAASLVEARTWELAARLGAEAWPPSLGAEGWGGIVDQAAITLAMSVLAIAIAFVAGTVLAFPAANLSRSTGRHRLPHLAIVVVARGLLIVLRAIPPPVWALLFLFVLFPGVLPAAAALGLYTTGVLGRLMADAAENLDERPLRALRSHGASGLQVFCYGVVPSATPRFVAYGLYRWEVTIRETVVVGVVGAGGLGLVLNQQLAAFDYAGATGTMIVLVVLTLLVDLLSAAVRRSLRG